MASTADVSAGMSLLRQAVSYRIVANGPGGSEAAYLMAHKMRVVACIKTRFEVKPGDRLKFKDGIAVRALSDDMGGTESEVIEVVAAEAPRRIL